jgi:hypothetical protein
MAFGHWSTGFLCPAFFFLKESGMFFVFLAFLPGFFRRRSLSSIPSFFFLSSRSEPS